MIKLIFKLFCALFFGSAVLLSAEDFVISADELIYSQQDTVANARGNVVIEYQTLRLTCGAASINQETRDFAAQGDVEITIAGEGTWKAPALSGNLDTKAIAFGPYRLDTEVWHAGGEGGERVNEHEQQLTQSWLSTCDREHPHYRLQASRIVSNTEDKTFTAYHVTMRVGNVPVFYLPVLWGSTDNSTGMIIKPGYSGKYGAYLELGRARSLGAAGSSKLFVRGMTKRGIGAGYNLDFETPAREISSRLFGIHDLDTAETEHGWDRRFKSREDRYRLHLYWREQLTPELSLRMNIDRLSDISMLEDWFRRDYRHWRQPKSFLDLSYDNSWMSASVAFRPRINSFYSVSEKLPEARIDIPRLQLFDEIPLVYSSESSLGFYSMKWRNNDRSRKELLSPLVYKPELHGDPADYSSFRADTLHTLAAPLDLGVLTLTPRASFRATAYSRTSKRGLSQKELADIVDADNPDNPDSLSAVRNYDRAGGSKTRFAAEFGIEAKTKLFSDWSDSQNEWLGIDGVRHILEPYVNYTFAPTPSVRRENLYFFDEIDRLERQNFVRLGLDQRWQTRTSEGGTRTFLELESYADIHLDRGEETGKHWGDFANRLSFYPNDALKLWAGVLHDIGDGDIMRGETGLRLGSEDGWNFSGKYTYRRDHLSRSAYSMGSSLADFFGESGYIKKHFEKADTISGTLTVPLNSVTSLEVYAEYDFDKNNLSEHHYYLTRELHCWTVMGGVGWDNGEFEAVILLRLTAFPNVKLDINI